MNIRNIEMLHNYTFGMEHELADVDRQVVIPGSIGSWSAAEDDIVNSDGRAIDKSGKHHTIGGEINTVPTDSVDGQVDIMKSINELFPEATINHRHHTHCHIAYTGFKENLEDQKKILTYAYNNSISCMDVFFTPTKLPEMNTSAWRYQMADRTVMQDWKYKFCMNATTVTEFKKSHQKVKDGSILPWTTKRYGVNLFSAYKHGTTEFRWFYPTLDPEEIRSICEFCAIFVNEALKDNPKPINEVIKEFGGWDSFKLPKEQKYNNDIELGWQSCNGKNGGWA